jgi:pimeloyl-ACP methyl ester carboxylesterase
MVDGSDRPAPIRRRRDRLWVLVRRWLRRLALVAGVALLVVTAGCWGYNAATAARQATPPGLRFVQTGPVRTRYLEWAGTGRPVVLVHGFVESADTWEPTARQLAGRFHVYALDLTGFGYSERTGRYTMDDQVDQVLAFLTAVDADGAVLVGHSSGAAIAAEATLRAPDRIGGLMFLDGDALATGPGAPSPVRRLLIDPYRTTLLRLAVRSDRLVRGVYGSQCGPSCPPLDAAGVRRWRRPLQVPGAESALWAMARQGVPGVSVPRLRQLTGSAVPRSVVFGAQDGVFDPSAAADTATRIGAPSPTLIAGGRHLTMISDPAAVAAAIETLAAR